MPTINELMDMGLGVATEADSGAGGMFAMMGAAFAGAAGLAVARRKAKIPAGVSAAAADGLRLVEDGFGGKGLTEGALKRARVLARGGAIPRETLHMMRNWFRRHQVDRRSGWNRDRTHGWVAWQLWGGHAGWRWAERLEGDPPRKIPAWASPD